MAIKCPYDGLTLKIATLSMGRKIEAYIEKVGEEQSVKDLEAVGESMMTYNDSAACAAHHGISAEALANSPNYEALKSEFQDLCFRKTIAGLKEKIDLSDKEAWALILMKELEDYQF